MKYFCISDIHGHYEEMIDALDKASFDSSNKNHMLVVIGDMVDRGPNCVEVLEYIYYLHTQGKAIVLLGNHDKFLLDFLIEDYSRTPFNFAKNGHEETIKQLLNRERIDEDDFKEATIEINDKYPYLKGFLEDMKLFYEISDYVLVHGGVDASKEEWRNDTTRTYIWTRMYNQPRLKDKTLVVGHTPAYYVRASKEGIDAKVVEKNNIEYKEYYEILFEENLIHIDGGVYSGGKINVLIIEE